MTEPQPLKRPPPVTAISEDDVGVEMIDNSEEERSPGGKNTVKKPENDQALVLGPRIRDTRDDRIDVGWNGEKEQKQSKNTWEHRSFKQFNSRHDRRPSLVTRPSYPRSPEPVGRHGPLPHTRDYMHLRDYPPKRVEDLRPRRPANILTEREYRRRPGILREFGDDFKRWEDTEEGSIGQRKIGKVVIDCKFRFGDSHWGVLGPSRKSAAIFYVDLAFHQPKGCELSEATVLISLQEHGKEQRKTGPDKGDQPTSSSLRVTDDFGPKDLRGKPITKSKNTTHTFTPNVSVNSVGVSGVGRDSQASVQYTSRWMVRGSTICGADIDEDVSSLTYRTLKWELHENEFEAQSMHRNVVHTGFTLFHDERPFILKVEIHGRLKNLKDRLSTFHFPRSKQKNQATSRTLVQIGPNDRFHQDLRRLASDLPAKMLRKNILLDPEALDVERALLYQSKAKIEPEKDVSQDADNSTSSIVENLSKAVWEYDIADITKIQDEVQDPVEDPVARHSQNVGNVTSLNNTVPITAKAEKQVIDSKLSERLSKYPVLLALIHYLMLVLDLLS